MGQTLQELASRKLSKPAIFNNRFVVEACESFHVHYRNLRINLSFQDWMSLGRGLADSFARWVKRGQPQGGHVELCRKTVAQAPLFDDTIVINLNKNLYKLNKDKVFAEGADFDEEEYIHLKIRDLRLEMPRLEFRILADAVKEADKKLEEMVQKL